MHNIESRLVIGPENILFKLRRMRVLYTADILQALAVKELTAFSLGCSFRGGSESVENMDTQLVEGDGRDWAGKGWGGGMRG